MYIEKHENDLNHEYLIEPEVTNAEKHKVICAASLVNTKNSVTQKVRIMNPFSTETTLYQDTLIGYAEPVDTVQIIFDHEDEDEQNNFNCVRNIKFTKHETNSTNESNLCTEHSNEIPEHLTKLYQETSSDKTENELEQLQQFFMDNQDVFSKNELDIGLTNLVEHSIELTDETPYKSAPRRVPLAYQQGAEEALQKMFKQQIVQESKSPWASPLVFVRKKNGKIRPCVDYRRLNSQTKKDAFPLPKIQDCFDTVADSTLFSSLDITSAYNQIPIKSTDIPKTAFVSRYGLYEFKVMSFGLSNAPATFQRLMQICLAGLQWKSCLVYLDDCLIFSKTFDEHLSRLTEVLSRIRNANLKLSPEKCHLFRSEVNYLGHILSKDGISPNKDNVAKILQWQRPQTPKEVQSFLGMANYYQRFLQNYFAVLYGEKSNALMSS